jgi:hypothetical protein
MARITTGMITARVPMARCMFSYCPPQTML